MGAEKGGRVRCGGSTVDAESSEAKPSSRWFGILVVPSGGSHPFVAPSGFGACGVGRPANLRPRRWRPNPLTPSTTAASSASTAARMPRNSPTTASTRCSTVARRAPGSSPATASSSAAHRHGARPQCLHRPDPARSRGPHRHRPHPLFHHRLLQHPERPTPGRQLRPRPDRHRPQRQPHQRRQLREELEEKGSIFQTTVDSEIILHLMAQPPVNGEPNSLATALRRIEGAYSSSS
jgi:hypothetical protein